MFGVFKVGELTKAADISPDVGLLMHSITRVIITRYDRATVRAAYRPSVMLTRYQAVEMVGEHGENDSNVVLQAVFSASAWPRPRRLLLEYASK